MRQPRQGAIRRARAAVGWALGLFVAGQVATGLLLEHAFPLIRFPAGARTLDRAREEPGPPAVAFLGDSRVMAAVDAAEANRLLAADPAGDPPPRVLNAAVPAGDNLSTELVYDQLVRAGRRPGLAVIAVMPETVGAHNPFLAHQIIRQPAWRHLAEWSTLREYQIRGRYLEALLVPGYAFRQPIVWEAVAAVRDRPPHRPPDETPKFLPRMTGTQEELEERLEFGIRYWIRPYLRDYSVSGPLPAALERVLDRCRADGVRIVLLAVPACSLHRAEFTPEVETPFREYVDRLVREYGCPFVDAREWIADEEFHDATHVSIDGRLRFTRRFTQEVLGARGE